MRTLRWKVKWPKGEKQFRHFNDAYRVAEALRSADIDAEIIPLEVDE